MNDRERGRRTRQAYRAAWRERQGTGNTDEAVFVEHLRRRGVTVQPDSGDALQEFILGCWRRGVSPSRTYWEIARLAGRWATATGRAAKEIYRAFKSNSPD